MNIKKSKIKCFFGFHDWEEIGFYRHNAHWGFGGGSPCYLHHEKCKKCGYERKICELVCVPQKVINDLSQWEGTGSYINITKEKKEILDIWKCENCVFFERMITGRGEYEDRGICKKNAPQCSTKIDQFGQHHQTAYWPPVMNCNRCGKFKSRETKH